VGGGGGGGGGGKKKKKTNDTPLKQELLSGSQKKIRENSKSQSSPGSYHWKKGGKSAELEKKRTEA